MKNFFLTISLIFCCSFSSAQILNLGESLKLLKEKKDTTFQLFLYGEKIGEDSILFTSNQTIKDGKRVKSPGKAVLIDSLGNKQIVWNGRYSIHGVLDVVMKKDSCAFIVMGASHVQVYYVLCSFQEKGFWVENIFEFITTGYDPNWKKRPRSFKLLDLKTVEVDYSPSGLVKTYELQKNEKFLITETQVPIPDEYKNGFDYLKLYQKTKN